MPRPRHARGGAPAIGTKRQTLRDKKDPISRPTLFNILYRARGDAAALDSSRP